MVYKVNLMYIVHDLNLTNYKIINATVTTLSGVLKCTVQNQINLVAPLACLKGTQGPVALTLRTTGQNNDCVCGT